MCRLFITNNDGEVIDSFDLSRYELKTSAGLQTLGEDLIQAQQRKPSQWQIKPAIAAEVMAVLEDAKNALADRPGYDLRHLKGVLRKLEVLASYQTLSPEDQRAALVDEMCVTAELTERIEAMTDMAMNFVYIIRGILSSHGNNTVQSLAGQEIDQFVDALVDTSVPEK